MMELREVTAYSVPPDGRLVPKRDDQIEEMQGVQAEGVYVNRGR